MTAMLTDMKLIPHSHFGMPGSIQKHMLVYVAIIAIVLTVFFDLSRIALLGAILYLVMDIIIHWGVLKKLRKEIQARSGIVITALILDAVVLVAFLWIKATSDILVVIVSIVAIVIIFTAEYWFLKNTKQKTIKN